MAGAAMMERPFPITYRRFLTRGELGASDGGLYNPGAYTDADGEAVVLVRHEVDYTWTQPAGVTRVRNHHAYTPLTIVGHDPGTRIEDARPFVFNDEVLVAHVRWKVQDRTYPIKPVLSRLDGDQLTRYDDWRLPTTLKPVEKNWVLLTHDATLHTVYSLSPLVIFAHTGGRWLLARYTENDWCKQLGKTPRNSTHLLPFRGGYLGWWHIQLDASYVTGAYWLDADLQLVKRTGVLLDGQWVKGDVYKAGVLYVSSQVHEGDDIHLFYGEGDAHSGVATLSAGALTEVLGL